ncbi:MAG: phenylalanine--tRNA ligase subunit beta [Nitrososphaerales archaeon]
MPVIELSLAGLKARTRNRVSIDQILNALPFIGLDIESQTEETVSVEYSPNRPDFSSEAGIARSLVGLLGIETGLQKYSFAQSQIQVSVEGTEIQNVRPYIFALQASLNVTDQVIKQLIVMQEDLHNGLGRRRSKVAIGIHNAEMVRPPIKYIATNDRSYSFVPLGSATKKTIDQILLEADQGREYGKLLAGGLFPLLIDSSGNTLSMPPIINGELTRLKEGVRRIFVDVTSTDLRSGETTIAIIASMLSDIGARIESVKIDYEKGRGEFTPNMMPNSMKFDLDLTNEILGLDLTSDDARSALEKSRLELLSNNLAKVPRYRSDIIHPVDLVEEVAIGYGISNLKPQKIKSSLVGSVSNRTKKSDLIVDILVGLDLTEIQNLSLTGEKELAIQEQTSFKVEDPKSSNYEFLRSEAIPSVLHVLGQSTHEEYPQRVFEKVSVFKKSNLTETRSFEEEHIAVAIASSTSKFTEIRSVLDAFLRLALPENHEVQIISLKEKQMTFAEGRTAKIILVNNKQKLEIGRIGEVAPSVLAQTGLQVPVCAFELNLEPFLKD